MSEADAYRQLAAAYDDIAMYRNLLALLPYTVPVNHEFERATERAALLLARIPTQRKPLDLRPAHRMHGALRGVPARHQGRRSS